MSFMSLKKLLPVLIPMLLFIGIIMSAISPEFISLILGEKSGFWGVLLGLSIGSIAFLPAFVAFPLGANLLSHGAGYPQIAAFISSLMAVGISSLGVEIKYFGKRTAIYRNVLGLIASAIFALIIWRVI